MTDPNWFFRDIAAWPWWLKVWLTLMLLATSLITYGLWTRPAREAAQCHRWYSAAATARDSLWIVTLRPECQP